MLIAIIAAALARLAAYKSWLRARGTLRVRWRVPRTLLMATLFIGAAEGVARWKVHTGSLKLDYSAKRLIEGHLAEISTRKPQVWLLGNSTLAYGVNEQEFGEGAGATVVKLDHGSATLRGDAAMLDYYLKRAPYKPSAVVVFVSMADLNINGYRADVSQEYISVAYGHRFRPQEWLVLYTAKQHISDAFVEGYERLYHSVLGKGNLPKPASDAKAPEPAFAGRPIPQEKNDDDFRWYMSLLKDYKFDDDAFKNVAKVARAHGVKDLTVVLVPTTDVLAKFQDKVVKDMRYARSREAIATACQQNGLRFLDCGQPRSEYNHFRDAQHLNTAGAHEFTAEVARMYHSHITTMVSTVENPPAN